MIGFPLDSHVDYDEDGIPVLDRAVTSEPMRRLIKSLFSDGVLPDDSTNLQVTTASDMNVTVLPGFAICDGCLKLEEEERTLAVQAADSTYDRIDSVVLRLNDNDSTRECDFYIVTGTPSSTPSHPDLTREGSIYEIALADIFVGSRSTRVTADKITDTRYNTERCGVISSISKFDTSTLNQQLTAWCLAQQSEFETWSDNARQTFVAWVETIQDILDESAAGHLQLEIETVDKARMGFEETHIDFLADGSIQETKSDGRMLITVFNEDGSIEKTLKDDLGSVIWQQTTTFNADGSIDVIKEV